MSEIRYVVHVLGPDDVLPQPDRATAVRVAHAINAEVAALGDGVLNDDLYPTIWAVVTTAVAADRSA